MAARARATGPVTGSGPKKGSASAETRGVAVVVKRKHPPRPKKNPPRPAGKQDASLSSYQLAPHGVVREEPPQTHRHLPKVLGRALSCGTVGGRGSAAEGEGAVDVDGVVYHAGQWYAVGWCHVR